MKKKKVLFVISVIVLIGIGIVGYTSYNNYILHRFEEITPNKFYSSGVFPPNEIEDVVKKHNIKTIIDFRLGDVQTPLNPATSDQIMAEREAALKIDGLNYINIPSDQVPTDDNLKKYFNVLDNPDNYPIWVHCYHGIGRAQIYSAIYRVEYEGFTPEEARKKTTWPLIFSNFDKGTDKGDYLINYKKKNN